MRRYTGADELGWVINFPAGSSYIEPGFTPAEDIQITIATWTEFAETCGESRVWASIHFYPAVEASEEICSAFGDTSYEYFESLMDGSAAERGPAVALAPDPRRDDRSE